MELILLICEIVDDAEYETQINTIRTRLSTQNDACNSAAQQEANGTYRMTEAFCLLATILAS